jgi:hypothetical protein
MHYHLSGVLSRLPQHQLLRFKGDIETISDVTFVIHTGSLPEKATC